MLDMIVDFFSSSGIAALTPGAVLMIAFGMLLVNLPLGKLMDEGGLLYNLYQGVKLGIYPPLIFLGAGASTDFRPLIANPKSMLLGAAAQLGIFFAFLGAIAIAAYSYMALVPVIQPPIIRALTTEKERRIRMTGLRTVSKREKIIFPIIVTIVVTLLVPSAAPLIGMLMLGNLIKEAGAVPHLVTAAKDTLMYVVTILLGITVGATASADKFLTGQTLGILAMGLVAFSVGTAGGVLFG